MPADNLEQKIQVAKQYGYSDEEINNYLIEKGLKYQAPSAQMEPYEPLGIVKHAPTIGSVAGGFGGPVGTGAGYSLGKSIQALTEQLYPLGKAGRTTTMPTGAHLLASQPGTTLKGIGSNLYNAMLKGEIGAPPTMLHASIRDKLQGQQGTPSQFFTRNVGESGAVTAADALLQKFVTDPAVNFIKDRFPKFRVGGFRPSSVQKSAGAQKKEIFRPIADAVDSAGSSKVVNITNVVDDLVERGGKILAPYADEPVKKVSPNVYDELADVENLIKELTNLADEQGNITLAQAQDIASRYGKATFTPVTGSQRVSTNPTTNAGLTAQRQAGAGVRSSESSALEQMGVDNAANRFRQYGDLAAFERLMKTKPFKGSFEVSATAGPAAAIGAFLSAMGLPQVGLPIAGFGAASPFIFMPYFRHLARQGLKGVGKTIPATSRAIISELVGGLSER